MPSASNSGLYLRAAGKLAERVPGLRAVPMVRLLLAAEVLVIGKQHLDAITPAERAQLLRLLAKAKGRPRNLDPAEQEQVRTIVARLEPRLFLAQAGERISPVGLPGPLRERVAGKPGSPPAPPR